MSELLKIRTKQAQRKAAMLAWEIEREMRVRDNLRDDDEVWHEWSGFKIADIQEKAAEAYELAMKLNRWYQHEQKRKEE